MSNSVVKRLRTQMKGKIYTNNKKGDTYAVVGVITNATNAYDGRPLVKYRRWDEDTGVWGEEYGRDHVEFVAKFTARETA